MHKRLPFRVNFSYSFVGNMVYSACLWLMLSSMTKLLPVKTIGMFVLAVAIITPIQLFLNLQLRSVQGSDANSEFEFGHYFALRLLSVTLMCVVVVAIGLVINKGWDMFWVLLSVVLYKSMDSYSDVVYGLLIKHERLDKVALSRICRGVIGLLGFLAVLFMTKSAILGFFTIFFIWAAIFLTFDLRSVSVYSSKIPVFNFSKIKHLVLLSLPLGVTMAIASFSNSIPRYITERLLGTDQLGYFGALAYIIAILRIGIAAVGSSSLARLSQYYIDKRKAFVKLLAKMVLFALTLGLAGVGLGDLFGTSLLSFVYSSDYAQHKVLFLWLLSAGGVGYISTMLCVGLTAARLFKPQVPLFLVASLLTYITCQICIPDHGIVGGAIGMLAGSLCSAFGALLILIYNMKIKKVELQI